MAEKSMTLEEVALMAAVFAILVPDETPAPEHTAGDLRLGDRFSYDEHWALRKRPDTEAVVMPRPTFRTVTLMDGKTEKVSSQRQCIEHCQDRSNVHIHTTRGWVCVAEATPVYLV